MELSAWDHDPGRQKIPCDICEKLLALKNKKPDCYKCGRRPVMDENLDFIFLWRKYSSFIGNGMGGVNMDTIKMIFELEGIEDFDLRSDFLLKFSTYYSTGKKSTRRK